MRNLLIALALIIAPTVVHAQAMRFPAANAGGGGGGGGGGCSTGGCSMTGDILFTASTGTCFDDAPLQCLKGDGAGGYQWTDTSGNVVLNYDLGSGLFSVAGLDTAGGVSADGALTIGGSSTLGNGGAGDTTSIDTGVGTNAVLSETGLDRSSAGAETYNIQNSGAGAMTLQVDGTSVLTSSTGCLLSGCTMTGGITFSAVTTDITSGTNEDIAIDPNGTGDVTIGGEMIITPEAAHASNALLITAGTQASNTQALRLTATLDGVTAATQFGAGFNITSAGSVATRVVGTSTNLSAGYTGSASTEAIALTNTVVGTGATPITARVANQGILASVSGATATGQNVGVNTIVSGATVRNIGLIGQASGGTDAIGVIGFSPFGTAKVGGIFSINSTAIDTPCGTLVNAGVCVSNGDVAAPIALFRDNGVTVVSVVDGGSLTFTGVTTDITTNTNEDLTIDPDGTGSLVIQGDGLVTFNSNNGTATGTINTGSGAESIAMASTTASSGIITMPRSASSSVRIGTQSAAASSVAVVDMQDGLSQSASGTNLWRLFGSGLVVEPPKSVTCADSGTGSPGALTIDVDASLIQITNNDANGCTITVSESSAVAGGKADIVVISSAGGTIDFADQAGILEMSATPYNMDLRDVLSLRYISTLNEWLETGRSVN